MGYIISSLYIFNTHLGVYIVSFSLAFTSSTLMSGRNEDGFEYFFYFYFNRYNTYMAYNHVYLKCNETRFVHVIFFLIVSISNFKKNKISFFFIFLSIFFHRLSSFFKLIYFNDSYKIY